MDGIKNKLISILRWSERYTKTDMIYLTENGFWLGISQLVSSGAVFLTSIAFANLVAPDIFGIYKYVISIVSTIAITTFSGMDSAVIQSVARGYEGTLLPGLKTKIKGGVFGTLIALAIGLYYYLQGNMLLATSFGIVAFFVPFLESFDIYNSLLFGKKLFGVQTIYNVTKKIIALVVIITTIFLTKNIQIILFVYFASIVFPNLFFLKRTIKKYLGNHNVDPEAIRYGKHLSFIQIIGLIVAELDKILVFQYIGAVDLAIYSLATAPADQIKGIFKNVNSLAMPQFAQKKLADIKSTIWSKVKILAFITTLIVLIYISLAPLFFKLFFPKYLASVIYSQVLSISLIPVVVAGFLYTALESQKAKKELYQYNLYSNIFSMIVLLPLVYYFGIMGAILSKILVRTFTACYGFILIKRID